jgi:hypothetical protein
MSEFEEKARAYCKARVEFLALRKKLHPHFHTCNYAGYEGEDHTPPCWHVDSEVYFSREGWCDECQPHYTDFHRRTELAWKFSTLARAMLQAHRAEENDD